jgi:hypothetical protein
MGCIGAHSVSACLLPGVQDMEVCLGLSLLWTVPSNYFGAGKSVTAMSYGREIDRIKWTG